MSVGLQCLSGLGTLLFSDNFLLLLSLLETPCVCGDCLNVTQPSGALCLLVHLLDTSYCCVSQRTTLNSLMSARHFCLRGFTSYVVELFVNGFVWIHGSLSVPVVEQSLASIQDPSGKFPVIYPHSLLLCVLVISDCVPGIVHCTVLWLDILYYCKHPVTCS